MLKLRKGLSNEVQVRQPQLQIRKPRPQEADLSKFTKYQVILAVIFIQLIIIVRYIICFSRQYAIN